MPKLVRLYITQVLIGFGVSAVFVALLLWLDVANLAHLVMHTEGGFLALFVLWFLNGIVFASVQFAYSIMRMAHHDDGSGGGKRDALPVLLSDPVPVPARKVRRQS
ncbi:hypothetical protein BXY66_1975 [Shimia isoporae]|uniref:Uncharacterized protein n=1 Tax=Shimia isoporae TaxID=647720 RepID=A0A4R1NXB1_9RHOB|nr:hypothetical protein [Shimia isoporae]TCL09908.1 hypothetical protein BXY66_1975 [Shimia isoporae]